MAVEINGYVVTRLEDPMTLENQHQRSGCHTGSELHRSVNNR